MYFINDINKIDFKYIEMGLKFYIKYGFSVCVVNGGGFMESDLLIVIIF